MPYFQFLPLTKAARSPTQTSSRRAPSGILSSTYVQSTHIYLMAKQYEILT